MYMYKEDLALNKLQGLVCHKTQPTNLYCNRHVNTSLLMEQQSETVMTFLLFYS